MKILLLLASLVLLAGCASTSMLPPSTAVRPSELFVTERYDRKGGMLDPMWLQGHVVQIASGRYGLAYADKSGSYYALRGRVSTFGLYVSASGNAVYAWRLQRPVVFKKDPPPPPDDIELSLRLGGDFVKLLTWDEDEFNRRYVPMIMPHEINPGSALKERRRTRRYRQPR